MRTLEELRKELQNAMWYRQTAIDEGSLMITSSFSGLVADGCGHTFGHWPGSKKGKECKKEQEKEESQRNEYWKRIVTKRKEAQEYIERLEKEIEEVIKQPT